MKILIIVIWVLSLAGCAAAASPGCTGTARHVNQPSVPVAAADVVCPAAEGV
ncbi:hypothetical protein Q4S45_13860 [Massilia sp. R2A-15]|uniref:hypothetical protein n=1 Tax=Massilia sp. R2A-15 TaxID=3064278 RepID=UPI0027334E4E|nr:hypothetical protein [Massilia sp. R2A-15]WLI87822.1 hypothetical protein Q4S45_13860 [Massilia sp. R2A-15]